MPFQRHKGTTLYTASQSGDGEEVKGIRNSAQVRAGTCNTGTCVFVGNNVIVNRIVN